MSVPSAYLEMLFKIGADHPALPGHFPGRPVVPGVVLLDQVIQALESAHMPPTTFRHLKNCKFIEPLLPNEPARIVFETLGTSLSFSIVRNDTTIVKGVFELESSSLS